MVTPNRLRTRAWTAGRLLVLGVAYAVVVAIFGDGAAASAELDRAVQYGNQQAIADAIRTELGE